MSLLRLAFAFGSGDISQNFAERLGRLVGSNTFGVAKSRAPEQRVHRRAQKHGHAFPCDVTMVEIPINRDGEMEIVPWPMLLPKDVMMSTLSSGYSEMLLGKGDARFAYWQKALLDYPSDQNTIRPEDSFPISIYGDEATIFRSATMVLHWQATLNPKKGDSLLSRFLIAIIPSEKYWCVSRRGDINFS